MRGNGSLNTSFLACKERARKATEIRKKKNGQIFEPKMFGLPLYLYNAALSTPIKRGSNGPAYARKGRGKGKERETKKEKNAGSNRKKQTKQKKKQQKKNKQTFP